MKYGVKCQRSSNSQFGSATRWANNNGEVTLFDTEDEANTEAVRLTEWCQSPNVSYWASIYE